MTCKQNTWQHGRSTNSQT